MHRDPAHREWNDVRNAMKQSGCSQLVLELTFTFNTPYGPWEGGKWHKSNQEACRVINEDLGKEDFLISTLREWILLDRGHYKGITDFRNDGDRIHAILDPDDFKHKGKKISLTRWFDFFGRLSERLPQWHSFFLVMLFQGVYQGFIRSRTDFPTMLSRSAFGRIQPAQQPSTAAECDPETTASPATEVVTGLEIVEPAEDPGTAPNGTSADSAKLPTARDSMNSLRQKCPTLSQAKQQSTYHTQKRMPRQEHSACSMRGPVLREEVLHCAHAALFSWPHRPSSRSWRPGPDERSSSSGTVAQRHVSHVLGETTAKSCRSPGRP